MCGIAGFNWSDADKIKAMTDAMVHRGPDDSGHYTDDNISLGHRRLSIIDLSSAGHQPMFDEEKELAIVYNGEIYNFQEIKEELIQKGYKFKSQTDTEVILYAYKKWGPNCIKKFKGMFAFAIYDIKKKHIFLARDHIGIKPLYYFFEDNRFIFSSTIPPIFIHKIPREPNKKAIRDFLLYNITDHLDETFFMKIMKFPMGQYAIYDIQNNNLKWHKWWENSFTGDSPKKYLEAVKELRELMIKSVDRHLISDVPVGTCLSGGIDSSSIACLINESKRTSIKTFSAVFPGFSKDESKFIDIVSSKTGMVNHKVAPSAESVKNDLSDFIRFMGEPVPSPAPYAHYKVCQLAKNNNVTVLLDGQGGDELFAGYHYFYGFYIKGLMKKGNIHKAVKEIYNLIKGGEYKIGMLSLGFLLTPLSIRKRYFVRKSNISQNLLKNKKATTSFFKEYYTQRSLHDALKFHLDYKLEHLLKWEDRNPMAHSREARVPLLDIDVMQFVFELPEEFIISQGKTKRILRDAMAGVIPEEIIERTEKIGFTTPEQDWLREAHMKGILNEFLKKKPLCEPYINLDKTRKMIKSHLTGKKDHGRVIWKTIFLEVWLKAYTKGGGY